MRKNGVDRKLTEIDGGVCAPSGFSATAVRCDFLRDDSNIPDFALITAKKRCATAYLPTRAKNESSFVSLTQKHVRTSLSSAILINSGIACNYGEQADDLAEKVSRLYAKTLKIDRNKLFWRRRGNTVG